MSKVSTRLRAWRKAQRNARKKPDVWVLDKQKVAFIQIRKVASRSARFAFTSFLMAADGQSREPAEEDIERIDRQYARHIRTAKIARLRDSYYVFTIVRNPLARLHSCYANKFTGHRERGLPNPFTDWGMHNDMSFAEFVQQVALIPDLQSNTHFRSMHPFLTHRGKLLPHTICKLEHLEKDWQVVRQNIPGFPDLPRINQTNFSDQPAYLSAYNRELAQLAYGRYQQDIELLGYEEEIQHMIATLA